MPASVKANRLLLEQIETLPPLEAIASRILAATDDRNASANDLARILSEDQAIAAKLLRVANSPYYCRSSPVTEISRAVVILGTVAVRNLVVGLCVRDSLVACGAEGPLHRLIWRHAIAVAAESNLIAAHVGYDPPEEAMLAGLLHDIGRLALAIFLPEACDTLLAEADAGPLSLEREQAAFGLDHTAAGERILTNWRLPHVLCRVVRSHHDDKIHKGGPHARLLAIVVLANAAVDAMGVGLEPMWPELRLTEQLRETLGLPAAALQETLDGLEGRIAETAEMLAINARTDTATAPPARPVVWIADEHTPPYTLGTCLLQHWGCAVQRVTPSALADALQPGALVLVDVPQQPQVACSLAQILPSRDGTRALLLADPPPGAPPRTRDAQTGVCTVPRAFTIFDLRWFEEQPAP